jgi:hypothetical protein
MDDQIQHIADTLLSTFLPKNQDEKTLSFHFTLPPNSSYKVFYEKSAKGVWEFIRAEKQGV